MDDAFGLEVMLGGGCCFLFILPSTFLAPRLRRSGVFDLTSTLLLLVPSCLILFLAFRFSFGDGVWFDCLLGVWGWVGVLMGC